ncbi:MAG: efflux RND transporter periplasmic adaptor subunit [Desulfomonile tiedjei]|nr:efflux RND transporter periplasmic adaptor subunit [Desulfomonile tiedjei]
MDWKTMITGRIVAILACCLLIFTACSRKQESKPPPPAMSVGVVTLDRGNIEQTLDVSGTLTYVANTTVSAEVSAQVKSIEVYDGEPVALGQLLLIFDETKIQATRDQALGNLQKDEATLAFSKTEWEKNLELFKSGAISQTQYDQKFSVYRTSVGQVEADRAALAKANEDLKKTKVLAPIPGLLSDRYVEKGDWVSEGRKLFQVSDYSKIRLEAFISDLDVGKLNVKKAVTDGVDAEVTVDSYPGTVFKGKLTYIQPVANQSRLFQIRIYLENPEMQLLQGMFARGRIVVKVTPDMVRVPISGLLEQVRENDSNTVFVVDQEEKAKLVRIKIGKSDARNAAVLEGANVGDKVVVRGKEILSSGQPLQVTELPRTRDGFQQAGNSTSQQAGEKGPDTSGNASKSNSSPHEGQK